MTCLVPDSLSPNVGLLCSSGRAKLEVDRNGKSEKERAREDKGGREERDRRVDHTRSSKSEARSTCCEMIVIQGVPGRFKYGLRCLKIG
jgi:hypothetical protein